MDDLQLERLRYVLCEARKRDKPATWLERLFEKRRDTQEEPEELGQILLDRVRSLRRKRAA